MNKFLLLAVALVMAMAPAFADRPVMPVIHGETFPDTDGRHINAHGGMILEKDGTFYWYGEHRGDGKSRKGQDGVACYTSTDLRNWHNRGIVLPVSETPGHPLERGCIIERPKVVYNALTDKYVMWFHHEEKGRGYDAANAGVAVADNPLGPFRLLRTGRVNPGIWAENAAHKTDYPDTLTWWTPRWREAVGEGLFHARDLVGGQMARDMTIFVDDDGKAYHIYSSEENLTLQIAELDSTYTRHTGRYIRIFPGGHNEAPALFKHDGVYWMITSGCTGWEPNEARLMRAESIMGLWTQLPNPCRGEGAKSTFESQSTYVLCLDGRYTFMADRWNPANLADSRHLWLPVRFTPSGTPYLQL